MLGVVIHASARVWVTRAVLIGKMGVGRVAVVHTVAITIVIITAVVAVTVGMVRRVGGEDSLGLSVGLLGPGRQMHSRVCMRVGGVGLLRKGHHRTLCRHQTLSWIVAQADRQMTIGRVSAH